MMMRSRVILVLALVAAAASACVPRVQQPEVWLEGARLSSVGLTGGVIDVRLSVHNPNRFAVQARGLTYELEVRDPQREQWVPFTDGQITDELRLGGRDTLEVTVPVEFNYRGLNEAVRALVDRGSFDYRLVGVVELVGPVRRDIRYHHTGRYAPSGAR
jgi:LEA14-like dessication related protein